MSHIYRFRLQGTLSIRIAPQWQRLNDVGVCESQGQACIYDVQNADPVQTLPVSWGQNLNLNLVCKMLLNLWFILVKAHKYIKCLLTTQLIINVFFSMLRMVLMQIGICKEGYESPLQLTATLDSNFLRKPGVNNPDSTLNLGWMHLKFKPTMKEVDKASSVVTPDWDQYVIL